ncbi:hypothetical protein EBU94_09530, partial [bacterium]|nr:hypothetical protein [bacterium]
NLQLLYNTYRTDILVPHPDTYGKRNILQRLGFNKSEIEIKQLQDTLIRISNICSKGFTEDEPVFYNLFTSVPYPTDIKEPKNQQTARVKILLKAQDDYNKNLTEDSKKYFLTLNIPTNGFGYPPSPYSISSLARELSLRNDMAIAMILGSLKEQDKLMNPYKTFLQSGKIYIKDSEQAQSIRDEINNIKNKQIPTCDSSNAFKCTLQLIYQNNLHYTHEFTLLTQTMALLCEEQSINGCKSGNERTAQILGRVEQGEKLKDKIIEVMNMHHITPQEKRAEINKLVQLNRNEIRGKKDENFIRTAIVKGFSDVIDDEAFAIGVEEEANNNNECKDFVYRKLPTGEKVRVN